jgi:hypothetical protein
MSDQILAFTPRAVGNPSYVHGTSDVPLLGDTIGMLFDQTVARFADREAIVVRHQGVRWTYGELQQRLLRGRRDEVYGAGQALYPGPPVPLLWHGVG